MPSPRGHRDGRCRARVRCVGRARVARSSGCSAAEASDVRRASAGVGGDCDGSEVARVCRLLLEDGMRRLSAAREPARPADTHGAQWRFGPAAFWFHSPVCRRDDAERRLDEDAPRPPRGCGVAAEAAGDLHRLGEGCSRFGLVRGTDQVPLKATATVTHRADRFHAFFESHDHASFRGDSPPIHHQRPREGQMTDHLTVHHRHDHNERTCCRDGGHDEEGSCCGHHGGHGDSCCRSDLAGTGDVTSAHLHLEEQWRGARSGGNAAAALTSDRRVGRQQADPRVFTVSGPVQAPAP